MATGDLKYDPSTDPNVKFETPPTNDPIVSDKYDPLKDPGAKFDVPDNTYDKYKQAKKIDPEKASKVLQLSDKTGLPPTAVESNLAEAQKAQDFQSPDYFKNLKTAYPNTNSVVSKPDNLVQMSDVASMDGAKKIEDHVNDFNIVNSISNLYKNIDDPEFLFKDLPSELMEKSGLEDGFDGIRHGLYRMAATAMHLAGVPEADNKYNQWANFYQKSMPDNIASQLGEAIPSTAAVLGLAASGQVGAIPAFFGIQTAGESHEEAINSGANQAQALASAGIKGAVSYFTGKAGFDTLSGMAEKMIPVLGLKATKQAMLQIGTTLAISIFGLNALNAVQQYANAFAEKVTNINPDSFDGLGDRIKHGMASTSIIASLFAIPAIHAISSGTNKPDLVKAQEGLNKHESEQSKDIAEAINNNEKEFIKEIGEKTNEVPIAKRNPNVMAEIIKENVAHTPFANVFVPFKAWSEFSASQRLDPVKEAERMGLDYSESELRGETGNLKIPMEKWIKYISKTPAEEALIDNAKLSEDGQTTNEIKNAVEPEAEKPKGAIAQIFDKLKEQFSEKPEAMSEESKASIKEIAKARARVGIDDNPIEGMHPDFVEMVQKAKKEVEKEAVKKLDKFQEPEEKSRLERKRENFLKFYTKQVEDDPRTIALENLKDSGIRVDHEIGQMLAGTASRDMKQRFDIEAQLQFGNGTSGEELARSLNLYDPKKQIINRTANAMLPYESPKNETPAYFEEAMNGTHTDKSLEALALESSAVRHLSNGVDKFKSETKENMANVSKEFSLPSEANRSLEEWKRQVKFESKVRAVKAKFDAEVMLNGKNSKDSSNPKPFYTAERNAAMAFTKYMKDGDLQNAWKAKDEQVLNHALAMKAWKNKAEVSKAGRVIERFAGRKEDIKNIPYGHAKIIDSITEGIGAKEKNASLDMINKTIAQKMEDKARSINEQPNYDQIASKTGMAIGPDGKWSKETIHQFLDRHFHEGTGMSSTITDDVIAAMSTPQKDLTLSQLTGIKDAILTIANDGNAKTEGLTGMYKDGMETCGKQLIEALKNSFGDEHADVNHQQSGLGKNGVKEKVQTFMTGIRTGFLNDLTWTLTLARIVDGGDTGPFHDYIYRLLSHAENEQLKGQEQQDLKLAEILDKHYPDGSWYSVRDDVYHFPFWKKEGISHKNLRGMLQNCGNESNFRRVMSGFNINEDQVHEMLSKLYKRDWDYVQDVGNLFAERYPDRVQLEKETKGVEAGNIESKPIMSKYGVYDGWYHPAKYQQDKSIIYQDVKDIADKAWNNFRGVFGPNRDSLKSRTYETGKALNLGGEVTTNYIKEQEHDLAFRKAHIDVQRFINQPEVQKQLQDSLSMQGYKNLQKWLTGVAGPKQIETSNLENHVLNPLYKSFIANIAFRPLMFPLKYVSDVLSSVQREAVQKKSLYGGLTNWINTQGDFLNEIYSNGGTGKIVNQIHELSPMMKNRRFGFTMETQSLKDLKSDRPTILGNETLGRANEKINEFGFTTERLADAANTYAKWWSKYHENLMEHGSKKAIDIADESVKEQFGTASALERTDIQKTTLGRIFAPAYTYSSMVFQHLALAKKTFDIEWSRGNNVTALKVASYALLYIGAQGMNEYLQRELFKNEDNRRKWKTPKSDIAIKSAELVAGTIPVAGTAARWALEGLSSARNYQHDYQSTMIDGMLQTTLKPVKDTEDFFRHGKKHGKVTESDAEDMAKTAQIIERTPQLANTLIFNMKDALQHNDLRWQDFVGRRTGKKD